MKKRGRYDVSHLTEAQFEPGSHGRVLINKLGIKRKREMDRLERQEQFRAIKELARKYDNDYKFSASDIKEMHKLWLGNIYEWAGEYRMVNISKDEFSFAAANQVPKLMKELESKVLRKYTPCQYKDMDRVVEALSIVHAELVLIHPFREGNGRVARLLSILMALQAGLPPLDFRGVKGRKRKEYFLAVQAGLDQDYTPMKKIFKSVIRRTIRNQNQ